MKKVGVKKSENTALLRGLGSTKERARKTSNDFKPLKSSRSHENMLDNSSKNRPQRMASTPTHDRTCASESPDRSPILENTTRPVFNPKTNLAKQKASQKTVISDGLDLQQCLDIEYTKYIQTVFKSELDKLHASSVENDLICIQKRIAENEEKLAKNIERLKKIDFSKEVDFLHRLHNPNYGKVLETLDNSNFGEYISTLEERMERVQNQLKMKNVDVPSNGGAELEEGIKNMQDILHHLGTDFDFETSKVLSQISEDNKNTEHVLKRCTERLSASEDLYLTRATLDICSHNQTKN